MRAMLRLDSLAVVSSLCVAAVAFSPRPALAQPRVIALDVTGPQANPGKFERCVKVAQKQGFMLSPQAPVRVMLILNPGSNRLQITSARRGEVLNQMRPPWGMEELCRDAMQAAAQALSQDNLPPVGPPQTAGTYGAPPPAGYPPPPAYSPPPPAYQPPPPSGPPTFAISVVGPAANPGKFERCIKVAQKSGVVVDPNAPLRVTLTLLPGVNKLQVQSARRGQVLETARPPWGMEELCRDAVQAGVRAFQNEGAAPVQASPLPGSVPPPARRPPPAMALGPIPPGADLPGPAKAAAERAVAAWTAARFDGALEGFREAARLHPEPQFLFDQAVCEQRLGRYTEALQHTQQFMDRAPHSPYRPYADQLWNELQQALGNE